MINVTLQNYNPYLKMVPRNYPKNYRPISLLPVVSKIIEKSIQIPTQEYLDQNGSLCKYQSGFRANVSTDSYLVEHTDFILTGMDKGFHTEMILVPS